MKMIFITSYTYFSPRHFKVFDYFQKKDDLVFILPKKWREKDGSILNLTERPGFKVIPTKAYFYHSHYPLIRGLLKGYMPATRSIIKKMSHPGDVLYTAMEPNLLATYLNGRLARDYGLNHIFAACQNVHHRKRLNSMKLRFTEWLIRQNIKLSSGGICAIENAREILKDYVLPEFPLSLVSVCGVDTSIFSPDVPSDFRKRYKLENKVILMFIGMLETRKGILTLLKAFSQAVHSDSKLHLVLIGKGPLRNKIEEYTLKHKINSSVTVIPWIENENLPGYFGQSDIFVYPSEPYRGWEEQLGFSIQEATASGLPIISTRMGSIDELVLDGENGILIQPGNVEELTRAILRLGSDEDMRHRMGKTSREHALATFSHKVVAQKLEKFLRSF